VYIYWAFKCTWRLIPVDQSRHMRMQRRFHLCIKQLARIHECLNKSDSWITQSVIRVGATLAFICQSSCWYYYNKVQLIECRDIRMCIFFENLRLKFPVEAKHKVADELNIAFICRNVRNLSIDVYPSIHNRVIIMSSDLTLLINLNHMPCYVRPRSSPQHSST